MSQIRVLLTDDHTVVRSGIARLLERDDSIEIAGEAESGEQAYRLFNDIEPDVVVMDMSMPGIGGLESLRRIKNKDAGAKVLMFSMHENINFAVQAMTSGASGYLTKSAEANDLVSAVKQVFSGKSYLSAEIAHKIAIHNVTGQQNPMQKLTPREFEVFRLLAEGLLIEEISELMNIGQKTVSNYQTSLKQKLSINSSVDLVKLALEHEVIN